MKKYDYELEMIATLNNLDLEDQDQLELAREALEDARVYGWRGGVPQARACRNGTSGNTPAGQGGNFGPR